MRSGEGQPGGGGSLGERSSRWQDMGKKMGWGGVGGVEGKMNEGEILFPSRSAIFLLSQELSPGTCREIHCGCLICLKKHTQAASLPCECQSNSRTQI